ncbi:uncharacterized protein [Apostichopus japonicus]|uniref:uncharacterized protein n=1 Tax=Stichopus japonicus TaxID=307972 RepID=UPI003AB4401D
MEHNPRRDCSILLKVDGGNVFEVLKRYLVSPAEHLTAVQSLPGGKFDVTFKSVEMKRKFWPVFREASDVTATAYTDAVKIVTVLHVPHELNDNAVRYVLGRYGKVFSGRYLTHKEYPELYNGVRQYRMEMATDIPSSLSLGGRNCWVRYGGQPRTCLKCGAAGHDARNCDVIRCFRCLQVGHVSRACSEKQICTTCGNAGHAYTACPVSFANKLKLSTAWVGGAAEVLPPSEEEPTPPEVSVATKSGDGEPVPSEDVSAVDVTKSGDDVTMVDDTPTSSSSLFSPEREVELDEAMTIGQSWADAIPDTPAQEPTVLEVQATIHVPPGTGASDERGMESDVGDDFTEVRRGLKRPPSTPPRRSRSLYRVSPAVQKAKDVVRAANVVTEEKPWFSCAQGKCKTSFRSYRDFLCHLKERHPGISPTRFECPLKSCNKHCTNPFEWAMHLSSQHPHFVCMHDVSYFNQYFLKDL